MVTISGSAKCCAGYVLTTHAHMLVVLAVLVKLYDVVGSKEGHNVCVCVWSMFFANHRKSHMFYMSCESV